MRPLAIMVTFELHDIFVTCIGSMELLCMVRLNEIILESNCKKCWDKTFFNVAYRREIVHIEVCLASNSRSDYFKCSANQEIRNLRICFG